jgi:membrane protease YdiL (CAAX protease family)
MSEEIHQKEFNVGHGIGIFVLLLVAVVIVGGISMVVFGFHIAAILGELIVLLVPLSFLHAGGYSFHSFLAYRGKPNFSFWILTGLASVSLFLITNDISGYLHQLLPRPEIQKEALLKIFLAKTWPEYLFRIFAACVLAGFCEEFAFRGFLQSVFSKRLGGIKGFVLTAFLFAVLHLDPWNFAPAFLLGAFLGYLVYLTGNLWVAILVHFFVNSIAFSINFFYPQVGSNFEYTSPPYVTFLFTILFITSLNLIRKVYLKAMTNHELKTYTAD